MKDRTWAEMYKDPTDADISWARDYAGGDVVLKDMAYAILHDGYQCRECGRWFPSGSGCENCTPGIY